VDARKLGDRSPYGGRCLRGGCGHQQGYCPTQTKRNELKRHGNPKLENHFASSQLDCPVFDGLYRWICDTSDSGKIHKHPATNNRIAFAAVPMNLRGMKILE
jgi:hypothetical protein